MMQYKIGIKPGKVAMCDVSRVKGVFLMKLSKLLLIAAAICLLLSMSVFATELDIYGKIAGRVVDKSTNQPLIFCIRKKSNFTIFPEIIK